MTVPVTVCLMTFLIHVYKLSVSNTAESEQHYELWNQSCARHKDHISKWSQLPLEIPSRPLRTVHPSTQPNTEHRWSLLTLPSKKAGLQPSRTSHTSAEICVETSPSWPAKAGKVILSTRTSAHSPDGWAGMVRACLCARNTACGTHSPSPSPWYSQQQVQAFW